jgi:glycerophosphoryl diester phosphodiesterase
MSGVRVAMRRNVLRIGLLSGMLTAGLVVAHGANPYASPASALQGHGALQRHGGVGIISHRGAAAQAPENTIAAIQIAIAEGADFVETDVRLSSDGVPVIMHDPRVDRTTNGTGRVAFLTLAEIRALDAGSWFSPEFAGEPVPTLAEFVSKLAPTTTRALIELKGTWTPERIDELTSLLHEHQLVNRVVLQSFVLPTLEMLQAQGPEFARLLLTRSLTEEVVATAVSLQVSAVGARDRLFQETPGFAERVRAVGIGTAAYTLNNESQWEQAARQGIDLVVTDDPVALAAWRDDQR